MPDMRCEAEESTMIGDINFEALEQAVDFQDYEETPITKSKASKTSMQTKQSKRKPIDDDFPDITDEALKNVEMFDYDLDGCVNQTSSKHSTPKVRSGNLKDVEAFAKSN